MDLDERDDVETAERIRESGRVVTTCVAPIPSILPLPEIVRRGADGA